MLIQLARPTVYSPCVQLLKCPVDGSYNLGACTLAGWSTTSAFAPRGIDYTLRSDGVAQIAIGTAQGKLQLCTVNPSTNDASCTQYTVSGATDTIWDVVNVP